MAERRHTATLPERLILAPSSFFSGQARGNAGLQACFLFAGAQETGPEGLRYSSRNRSSDQPWTPGAPADMPPAIATNASTAAAPASVGESLALSP